VETAGDFPEHGRCEADDPVRWSSQHIGASMAIDPWCGRISPEITRISVGLAGAVRPITADGFAGFQHRG